MNIGAVDAATINECFYNMYGTGTRLVTWGLQLGKIVETVNVYGIAAAKQKPCITYIHGLCKQCLQV